MNLLLRALALVIGLGTAPPAWADTDSIGHQMSAAVEGSHVFCSTHCMVRSLYVTSGGTAGFVMTFNAASAPADGAVTPDDCVELPANSTVALDYGPTGDIYSVGFVAAFSTTGCFSKTTSSTAFFKARHQP